MSGGLTRDPPSLPLVTSRRCLCKFFTSVGRRSATAESVQREPASTRRCERQQPAHDGQVLHEVLHLAFARWTLKRPEVVEDERGRDQEHNKRRGAKTGLEPEQHQETATDFKDDGHKQENRHRDHPLVGHALRGLRPVPDLHDAAEKKNGRKQDAPGQECPGVALFSHVSPPDKSRSEVVGAKTSAGVSADSESSRMDVQIQDRMKRLVQFASVCPPGCIASAQRPSFLRISATITSGVGVTSTRIASTGGSSVSN